VRTTGGRDDQRYGLRAQRSRRPGMAAVAAQLGVAANLSGRIRRSSSRACAWRGCRPSAPGADPGRDVGPVKYASSAEEISRARRARGSHLRVGQTVAQLVRAGGETAPTTVSPSAITVKEPKGWGW